MPKSVYKWRSCPFTSHSNSPIETTKLSGNALSVDVITSAPSISKCVQCRGDFHNIAKLARVFGSNFGVLRAGAPFGKPASLGLYTHAPEANFSKSEQLLVCGTERPLAAITNNKVASAEPTLSVSLWFWCVKWFKIGYKMDQTANDLVDNLKNVASEGANKFADVSNKMMEAGKSIVEDVLSTPSTTSSMVSRNFFQ